MKILKKILLLICTGVLLISSCKKDAGEIGKKELWGNVTYKNGGTGTETAAPNAIVHIAYGTTSATTEYNQTVLADSDGKYSIKGLQKGDYYITGEFIDEHGFKYTSGGYGVTIKNKKEALQVDIQLQ